MRRRRILSNSPKHADVCEEFGMISLLPVVPLARHFYPPLTRAPSPRGYGLRPVQHELFCLLVFKMLNLATLFLQGGTCLRPEIYFKNSARKDAPPSPPRVLAASGQAPSSKLKAPSYDEAARCALTSCTGHQPGCGHLLQ